MPVFNSICANDEPRLSFNSGPTVSAPSHPGGARPGEGWRDGPGSAGPACVQVHSCVHCLTRAEMLHVSCCHMAHLFSQTTAAPLCRD